MNDMAKITYEDKVALQDDTSIADINKCKASDMNEIKSIVNDLDDDVVQNMADIASNTSHIGTLENLSTTTKNNLVGAINEVNNQFNYSTEEIKVGTWINDKPIYKKTISKNNFAIADNATFNHGIQNIDDIVSVDGTFYTKPELRRFPLIAHSGASLGIIADATKISFSGDDTWGASTTRYIYITLYYTKTTD